MDSIIRDSSNSRLTLEAFVEVVQQMREMAKVQSTEPVRFFIIAKPKLYHKLRHASFAGERGRIRHERMMKGKHGLKRPNGKRMVPHG